MFNKLLFKRSKVEEIAEKSDAKKPDVSGMVMTSEEPFYYPVEMGDAAEWTNSPGGELVTIDPEAHPIYQSKIATGYLHVKCGACGKDFWTWNRQHNVMCPGCRFPLEIQVDYAPR